MAQLNPYLNFNGNCREAMNFYKDCLGGDLTLQTVGEMPAMAAQMPPHLKDHILHSMLVSDGITIMGSDLNRSNPVEGNTFALCVNCDTADELHSLFTKLSAGGKISQPVGDMPWGALFGELTDKFGKNWMFNFQKA